MENLAEIIQTARQRKYTDEEIRKSLSNHFSNNEIEAALKPSKQIFFGQQDENAAQAHPDGALTNRADHDPSIANFMNTFSKSNVAKFKESSSAPRSASIVEDSLKHLNEDARTGAATAAGVASGMSSMNPVQGNATYAVVNNFLDAINKKQYGTPESEGDFAKNTAVDFLGAEIGGRALSKAGSMIKNATTEYLHSGSVVGDFANKTKQTFSQMTGHGQIVEDVFAPAQKKAVLKESFQLAEDEAESLVAKVTGINLKFTDDVARQAQKLADISKSNYQLATTASSKYGDVASVIAGRNLEDVIVSPETTSNVPSGILDASGNPVLKTITTPSQVIKKAGPIQGDTVFQTTQKLTEDIKNKVITPDANDKLVETANRLMKIFNPIKDEADNVISKTPLSFREAWDAKKDIQNYAEEKFNQNASYLKLQYHELVDGFNEDIEKGIAAWKNNPEQALMAWQKSKMIAGNRDASFFPTSAKGVAGKLRLDEMVDNIPEVQAIINNPIKLQSFLTANNKDIVLHTRIGPGGKPMVVSLANTNAKKELAATNLQMMFNDAKKMNQDGTFSYDTTKLQTLWNANEKSDATKILYNRDSRDQIGQFIKAMANIDQKFQTGGSFYLKARAATGAFYLSSGLINAAVTGANIPNGGIVGGAFTGGLVSLHYLGKMLTNPESARILAAAVKGGPLGMSSQLASRILMQHAVGMKMRVEKQDGSFQPVQVDQNGKFKEGKE